MEVGSALVLEVAARVVFIRGAAPVGVRLDTGGVQDLHQEIPLILR